MLLAIICPTKRIEKERVYTAMLYTNTTRLSVPDMLWKKSFLVFSWKGHRYNVRALGGKAVVKKGEML